MSIYTFYMAGRTAPGQMRPTELHCIYALVALPLIFLAVGETKVFVGDDYPNAFAYFPNKNTAALYFAALLFVLSQRFGNKVLLLQFINVALMNKVGPALATILAICMGQFSPEAAILNRVPCFGDRQLHCIRSGRV